MVWTRKREVVVTGSVIACVVVVGLFGPTAIGGWAPLAHWTCDIVARPASTIAWIPAILVNAPYGGYAAGNATIPPGLIENGEGLGSAVGLPASNGSVGGVFFHVFANLSQEENEIAWGPGPNSRCTGSEVTSLAIYFGSPSGQIYSGILGNTGNRSDVGEPNMYNLSTAPVDRTVLFDNGFSGANQANISTCGNPQKWIWVLSPGLTIRLSLTLEQQATPAVDFLPFPQAYHYFFPADFGTWQIDNLSAPGGPGGGWAFSYSPCP